MAEHHLDRAQIGAAVEQVRRERMPQHVRADVARQMPAFMPYSFSSFQKPTRDSGPPRALTNSHGDVRAARRGRASAR